MLPANKLTAAKTRSHVKLFQTWFSGEPYHDQRKIEDVTPEELDPILETFFRTIKTKDGRDYGPASYESVRQSLERHLKEQNYPVSMTTDYAFTNSQMAYKMRLKLLREISIKSRF